MLAADLCRVKNRLNYFVWGLWGLLLPGCGAEEPPFFSVQALVLSSNQAAPDPLEPSFDPIDSVEIQLLVSDYKLAEAPVARWQPIASAHAKSPLPEQSLEKVVDLTLLLLDSFQLAQHQQWLVPGQDILPYFGKLGDGHGPNYWIDFLRSQPALWLHEPWEFRLQAVPAFPQKLHFLAVVELSDGRQMLTNAMDVWVR